MQANVSPSVEVVSWEEENEIVVVAPEVIVDEVQVVMDTEKVVMDTEKTRGMAVKAAITAAFVAVNAGVLYFGTLPGPSFVHRWVLMAVGIVTGIVWGITVFPRKPAVAVTA